MVAYNKHLPRRFVAVYTALASLLGTAFIATAAPPAHGNPPQIGSDRADLSPLFNGRDFQGWQHGGNWKVAQGAFHGMGVKEGQRDLHFRARQIPPNCELVFEWKEDKAIDWKALGLSEPLPKRTPGFLMGYDTVSFGVSGNGVSGNYGISIGYKVPGIAVLLHTRNVYDKAWDWEHRGRSGYTFGCATKDFSKPVGQWNRSRIVCKDSRIQFWLNDSLAYDLDINEEEATTDGACVNREVPEWAVKEWLGRGDRGLFLSILGPESQVPAATIRVDIRSLAVRPLKPTERLAELEVFPSRVGKSPTNPEGVRWDWRSDPLYARLAFSSKDLPPSCTVFKRVQSFGPVMGITNPGGTTNPAVLSSFFPVRYLSHPQLQNSDVKSAFMCRYEEKGEICVRARQFSSPEKANLFRTLDLAEKLADPNAKKNIWAVGNYAVTLLARPNTSDACYRALQEQIERVVADVSKKP